MQIAAIGLYPYPASNTGIVPPWLQHPVTPLPGPNDDFFILPIEQARVGVEALR